MAPPAIRVPAKNEGGGPTATLATPTATQWATTTLKVGGMT